MCFSSIHDFGGKAFQGAGRLNRQLHDSTSVYTLFPHFEACVGKGDVFEAISEKHLRTASF
jgi:hypothetical protein